MPQNGIKATESRAGEQLPLQASCTLKKTINDITREINPQTNFNNLLKTRGLSAPIRNIIKMVTI